MFERPRLPFALKRPKEPGESVDTLSAVPDSSSSSVEDMTGSSSETEIEIDEDSTATDADADKDTERSVGTGVVILDNGTILTNLHVVAGAKRLNVVFSDGMESDATVVGTRPEDDLAVMAGNGVSLMADDHADSAPGATS